MQKYFGTDGIRGRVGQSLIRPEFVLKLGWALGRVIAEENQDGGKVLIGKDTRVSGYMLESALEAGLSAAGIDIHLLGPMPTPAIAYLTRTFRADAGVVISASHNLFQDNGIKFFSPEGRKLSDELEKKIEHYLEKDMVTVDSVALGKAMRVTDAPGRYIEFCKHTVPTHISLEGLKIVVDCANGATYHVAGSVFSELGAEVIELGVDPDGFNINAGCGSTKPKILQEIVKAEKADIGIALDGDGDRVIMIDHKGEVVDGDELLFVIAKDCFTDGRLGGGVVGTVMSNLGVEIAFREQGIAFERTKVGDRHVMQELLNRGWLLGGESSGHLVHLGFTTTGDGIISALQVLRVMHRTGQTLHELKKQVNKFPQKLVNVPISKKIDVSKDKKIKKAVELAENSLGNRGRVLLRASGTEPVIRVMVEGEDRNAVNTLADELAAAVAGTHST